MTIKQIIEAGLSLTSRQLNFTADKNQNDPNKLISLKTAHCIGYASFFATSCNNLLEKITYLIRGKQFHELEKYSYLEQTFTII